MDVWPWLVRHAGWLLEKYHVKANKKTAFEDCFGQPPQGEVMKFAEVALFRVAVSPSGKIRDGVRQGSAEARFVRGNSLERPRNQMNISSRQTLECTPRGQ